MTTDRVNIPFLGLSGRDLMRYAQNQTMNEDYRAIYRHNNDGPVPVRWSSCSDSENRGVVDGYFRYSSYQAADQLHGHMNLVVLACCSSHSAAVAALH